MSKRLFSCDQRADTILSNLRDKNGNISAYINNAVVDETLPVYSQLRVEALFLLDFVIDGAKNWTGNKLIIATGEDEIQYHTRCTIGRGISWLRNHHLKNCNILKEISYLFSHLSYESSEPISEIENENILKDVSAVKEKLQEINPEYYNDQGTLGNLAKDMLNHWDSFWDFNPAYDLLIAVVYRENPLGKLDPFYAIRLLQAMENQFIMEAIGDVPTHGQ